MSKSDERIAEDLAGVGHNSGTDVTIEVEAVAGGIVAREQLKSIIERIERLEEEKKQSSDDIRDLYAEAKGNGFDTKALRTIVRLRKLDPDERREQDTILETYLAALGMM